MPEAKIARRCPTCQIPIKDHAFFCPQCGDKLERAPSKTVETSPKIHDTEDVITDPGATLTESDFKARNNQPQEVIIDPGATLTESDFKARNNQQQEVMMDPGATLTESDFKAGNHPEETITDPGATLTESDFRAGNSESKVPAETAKLKMRSGALGEVGVRMQRVTTKARDVEGDVKQRVQKFRDISSVVIGEASYDPSLRFVLVAAALFVLFLVIVLLNKLIG